MAKSQLVFAFLLLKLLLNEATAAGTFRKDKKEDEPSKLEDTFILEQIHSECRFVEKLEELKRKENDVPMLTAEDIANYSDPTKLEDGNHEMSR